MIPILTAADWFFLPGLMTLFYSLREHSKLSDNQQIIVIEFEPFTNDDRGKLSAFGYDIKFVDIREFGDYSEIMLDPFQIGMPQKASMYWRSLMRKTLIFRLKLEKLVWLDADLLCLGDIRAIFDMPHLSLCHDWGMKPPQDVMGNPMVNTGVMVISPEEEDFIGLQKTLHTKDEEMSKYGVGGDQPVINWYFYGEKPDKVNVIHQRWNILKHIYTTNSGLFTDCWKDPKFVHYVSIKPWVYSEEMPCPEKDVFLKDKWMDYFKKAKKIVRGGKR